MNVLMKIYPKNAANVLIFSLAFLFSCQRKPLDVDVSGVKQEKITIKRMEKDLFETSFDSLYSKKLLNNYGVFYTHFISGIINTGGMHDSLYLQNLKRFINDKDMHEAYLETQHQYTELNELSDQLTDAFKHFSFYFPNRKIPLVVTYMSGFNYSIVNMDGVLGIGLEMYLGSDNKFYKMIQLPKYKVNVMRSEYILPDCMRGWMSNEFENNHSPNDFLGQIIQTGKTMYLVDALLPEVDDTLKIGYTHKQMEWCKKHEFNVWSYFIQQKLLYSKEISEIIKYTSDGPFTSAFNKESPSRTGNWIGWQIVKTYMKRNPDITLQQLIVKDVQEIFTKSKYKPGK